MGNVSFKIDVPRVAGYFCLEYQCWADELIECQLRDTMGCERCPKGLFLNRFEDDMPEAVHTKQ